MLACLCWLRDEVILDLVSEINNVALVGRGKGTSAIMVCLILWAEDGGNGGEASEDLD